MVEQSGLEKLKGVSFGVDEVELRHNEVVDVYAQIHDTQIQEAAELREKIVLMQNTLRRLETQIDSRESVLREMMLLLSLLGQHEELLPIRTRVENQQYEQYVDKHWLLARLQRSTSSKQSQR